MKIVLIGNGKGLDVVWELIKQKNFKYTNYMGCAMYDIQILGVLDDHSTTPRNASIPYSGKVTEENIVKYNKAIITSSNMPFRRKVYTEFKDKISFINIVGEKTNIMDARLGVGNIIFNNVFIENPSYIGNNNVISTGCIINHHNVIGDGNLLGPGCMLSGSVKIGNNCTFGSGVIVQPGVTIGNNVTVPSGTVIVSDIKDNTQIRAVVKLGESIYQGGRIIK